MNQLMSNRGVCRGAPGFARAPGSANLTDVTIMDCIGGSLENQ